MAEKNQLIERNNAAIKDIIRILKLPKDFTFDGKHEYTEVVVTRQMLKSLRIRERIERHWRQHYSVLNPHWIRELLERNITFILDGKVITDPLSLEYK